MNVEEIKKEFAGLDLVSQLKLSAQKFVDKIVFSTSFGWEDQVITHLIFTHNIPIKIFTLDTGQLFPETYYVWNRTLEIYGKTIYAYFPDGERLQAMVNAKGPSSFYQSVENRKECCQIRKIEPLKRALKGNRFWITGIRSSQSANRESMNQIEWDESNQLYKFHPLFYWTLDELKKYIKNHHIVYNSLHDKGFPSIGCRPCTRAVKQGEDFRAGRWWWENQSKKECGLHSAS